jgi:hypothetical protein
VSAHLFLTSMPVLVLRTSGVCVVSSLRFTRVLTYFDLRARPRLKDRWGLCYKPLAFCEGVHFFDLRARPRLEDG